MIVYTKTEYAKLKGVSVPYISKIRDKLKYHGSMVLDCKENDDLFNSPAWNRRKITKI